LLAEVRAQFEAFRATGLKLDHVTGHRHFHLHPSVTAAILGLAAEFGVGAVQMPLEPGQFSRRSKAESLVRLRWWFVLGHAFSACVLSAPV
jgi:predicted glycoside hydrolase/deacetylase ChbG (UPF0249 family)